MNRSIEIRSRIRGCTALAIGVLLVSLQVEAQDTGGSATKAESTSSGGSCFWMESRPPYNWQSRSRYDFAGCYAMDSCDGGQGHSGGGCYKWADCPTCDRYPWMNGNRATRPSPKQELDTSHYYRLTTQFRGDDQCLDVYNGGSRNNMTHIAPCANLSGQFWQLSPVGNGSYRLTTSFRGAGMCLDIFNGGARNNQPHITKCANYTGQFWKLRRDGDWYRLTTQFRGEGQCLDIFNGGEQNNMPHLANCAGYSGQFWKLTRTTNRVQ